ncbi:MAG: asparagine--tRNA ligase [Legionellaceae bacterium]|nr:asparagine--tRNA ligase [Legionellaceae bacterium]HAF87142.1 asparagine--tRNA ligase [Legionellales bacterium]HCA88742.1 asparagine--tRNA ligase [Legionellales bacterium]|tara:strand:- start:1205 stop:2605 length:1401 start_codon:yes stop_codon:yes gene_type:complete
MTELVSIKQCFNQEIALNSTVTLQGWIKTKRDSKAGISFIHLHDGSCFAPMQLVAAQDLPNYQTILKLTTGCALKATGKLVASQGKGQSCEVQVQHIEIIGTVEHADTYPIQAKRHTVEFLREVAHLRMRTNLIGAVTRIRHHLAQAVHQFFNERGYFWVHTPIITASDCEGAGEMFRVSTLDLMNLPKTSDNAVDFSKDFFGRETFLTVSGQLNVEAYCLAMSKVYTFGPTFRAENSNTSRHLAEFWMIEPELAFAQLQDICALSQSMLRFLCQSALDKCMDDMVFFNQHVQPGCIKRLEDIINADFEIMTYDEAIKQLQQATVKFTYPVKWGVDLQSEHERYLAETLCQKPVILINYPKDIKGFYMRLNDDEKTVAAMDVLAPGIGEIIGGSQREERLEVLERRMETCQLNKEAYQWYLDLRRYGSVPHAGFGLGFERLISYVTGVGNVRDVIPFPRTPGHAPY